MKNFKKLVVGAALVVSIGLSSVAMARECVVETCQGYGKDYRCSCSAWAYDDNVEKAMDMAGKISDRLISPTGQTLPPVGQISTGYAYKSYENAKEKAAESKSAQQSPLGQNACDYLKSTAAGRTALDAAGCK